MLNKILQIITKEDTFKIFTSYTQPSIYETARQINDPTNIVEIEKILKSFFQQIVQTQDPNSFYYTEAHRLLLVLDKVCKDFQMEVVSQSMLSKRMERDQNDELVDLYMESLDHFVAGIEEPVLKEHLKYLER